MGWDRTAGHARGSDVQRAFVRRRMDSPAEDIPGDLPPPLPPQILHERDCQGNKQCSCWGRQCADDDRGDASICRDVASHVVLHEVARLLLVTDDNDTGQQRRGRGTRHPLVYFQPLHVTAAVPMRCLALHVCGAGGCWWLLVAVEAAASSGGGGRHLFGSAHVRVGPVMRRLVLCACSAGAAVAPA
jgi:hypothetical protein